MKTDFQICCHSPATYSWSALSNLRSQGPLFKTDCFQMYGIVSVERKRRYTSHWSNWKTHSANQSQFLQCIYLSSPLRHAELFFLMFLVKLQKNRDFSPAQFLSLRTLCYSGQDNNPAPWRTPALLDGIQGSHLKSLPYERSNILCTAQSTSLHHDRGCFTWFLVGTEYTCASLQVHILQIIGVQLSPAHDIVTLHWPVRNTSDYFTSCISSQISNRSEHSALTGLSFCANQQAAGISKEQIKGAML